MVLHKRIYEDAKKSDGYRILIDRLWPRGISKEKAKLNLWLKEIAPSHELRKWFNHDPEKWTEFQNRYRSELNGNKEAVKELKAIIREKGTVTLLLSSKEDRFNNAVALIKILKL